MKSKNVRRLIFTLFLIGSLFYLSIMWLKSAPCPDYSKNVSNSPDYIDTVWPPPDSEIQFSCYMSCYINKFPSLVSPHLDSCVNVYIVPTKRFFDVEIQGQAVSQGNEQTPFEERVTLFVDGKKTKTTLTRPISTGFGNDATGELDSWYWFGSHPFLFPGEHTAKVEIVLKNGEKYEYEWHFGLTQFFQWK